MIALTKYLSLKYIHKFIIIPKYTALICAAITITKAWVFTGSSHHLLFLVIAIKQHTKNTFIDISTTVPQQRSILPQQSHFTESRSSLTTEAETTTEKVESCFMRAFLQIQWLLQPESFPCSSSLRDILSVWGHGGVTHTHTAVVTIRGERERHIQDRERCLLMNWGELGYWRLAWPSCCQHFVAWAKRQRISECKASVTPTGFDRKRACIDS